MNDYIDRQAVKDWLLRWEGYIDKDTITRMQYRVIDIPSVEVEPVKHGRWIPVSERLPEQGQEVICQCRASIITVLKLDANGDWYQDVSHCYMRGFVIAWMPLPEPYAEEGEAHEID